MSFSVAKVAKELGISQGNLTYYFPKRENLIESVVERLIVRYTSNPHFDFELGKHEDDIISKYFLKFLLSDARNPAIVKVMIFIWSNALTNKNVALVLSNFYKTSIDAHLKLSGNEGTAKQSQTMYALLTDLSPKFKTMTLMRFPINWSQWRSQNEKTLHRRTNHQSHQTA